MQDAEICNLFHSHAQQYNLQWIKHEDKDACRKFVKKVIKTKSMSIAKREFDQKVESDMISLINKEWNNDSIVDKIKQKYGTWCKTGIDNIKRRIRIVRKKLKTEDANNLVDDHGLVEYVNEYEDMDIDSKQSERIVYPQNIYELFDGESEADQPEEKQDPYQDVDPETIINYIYDSDDSNIEYDPGTIKPPLVSAKCTQCKQEIQSHVWGVKCYHDECDKFQHRGCLFPDLYDKQKMYCLKHFEDKYLSVVPYKEQKDGLYLLRVITIGRIKHYYYVYSENQKIKSYKRTSNDLFESKLSILELILQETYTWRLYDFYRIGLDGIDKVCVDEFIDADTINQKSKEIIIQKYKMKDDPVPIGTADGVADEFTQNMLKNMGLDYWDHWQWYCWKYSDSIQGGGGRGNGNRMKVHGNQF